MCIFLTYGKMILWNSGEKPILTIIIIFLTENMLINVHQQKHERCSQHITLKSTLLFYTGNIKIFNECL